MVFGNFTKEEAAMKSTLKDWVNGTVALGLAAAACVWSAGAYAKEHEATRALQDSLWDAAPRPRMPIAPATGVIAVDGKLDEAAWKKASVFNTFIRVKTAPGSAVWGLDAAQAQTRVFVCYDARNLYVGFDMDEPYVHVLKTQSADRDGSLWRDDCAEFMLDPQSAGKRLIHFIWNGLGQTYDADTHRGDVKWNCEGLEVKAARDEKELKWFVEASIPLNSLDDGEVKPGALWRVSLGRERHASEYKALVENSLWNGQAEGSFETPHRFGEMLFTDVAIRDVAVPQAHLGAGKIAFSLCSARKRSVTVEVRAAPACDKPLVAARKIELAANTATPVTLDFENDREGAGILYVTVKENNSVLACLRRTFYVAPLTAAIEGHIKRMETILAGSQKDSVLYTNVTEKLPALRAAAGEVEAFRKAQAGRPFTDESRGKWDALGKRIGSYSGLGTYVVWACSPWLKSNQREMPQTLSSGAGVTLKAARDEVEYGAFMLSNLTGDPLAFRLINLCNIPNVKLMSSPIPTMKEIAQNNPAAAHMNGNTVSPDPIALGEPTSGDPLLTLNEWGEVYVPPFSSKRVLVRADTHGMKPGGYSGSFRVQPLTAEYAPSAVSVQLTVWPFAVPAETPLSLYLWDYAYKPADLDEMKAHRVSHFMINCDAQAITNAVETIRAKRQRGKLIGSYGIIAEFEKFAESKGYQRGTDAYREAFAKYLNDWVAGVTNAGVALEDLAVQHIDEPYGEAIKKIVELGPVCRKEQPKLKWVLDCMTPIEELKEVAPYCDIYGFRGYVLYEPFKSFLDEEKKKGKQIWSFTCQCPVADRPPLSYWRMRPWWCYKQNMDGIMIFAWVHLVHFDYGSANHVPAVPTLGYEAIAQGMEDYCLLVMLRDLADQAEKAGKKDLAEAGRKVLETALAEVVQDSSPTVTEADLAERLDQHRVLIGEQIVALRKALGVN